MYNIALEHNRELVTNLVEKFSRKALNLKQQAIGYSEDAWIAVRKGKVRWPGLIPATYSDEEMALYIILASQDESINEELQKLIQKVKDTETAIAARTAAIDSAKAST